MPTITVRLDEAQEKKLARMARWRRQSKSATMREILDARIETGADMLRKMQADGWKSLIPVSRPRRGHPKANLS